MACLLRRGKKFLPHNYSQFYLMKLSTIFSFLFLSGFSTFAQCPESTKAGVHVMQQSENLYRISQQYNVQLSDLYTWNQIKPGETIDICREIYVVNPANGQGPKFRGDDGSTGSTKGGSRISGKYVKQSGGKHIVNSGETIDGIAKLYGYTSDRFREFNGLAVNQVIQAGSVLLSSDCDCTGKEEGTPPTSNTDNISNTDNTSNYMTGDEIDMIAEINLLRSNPSGYIPYIEGFIADMKENGEFGDAIATAKELINVLKKTKPMGKLTPLPCLYEIAQKHAEEQKPKGDINHQGEDGSWPWDRILKGCTDLVDGNENIVAGPSAVRQAIIILLVDDGIKSRGHRNNLINANWKYVTCYKIGQVGEMPNFWLQLFAN